MGEAAKIAASPVQVAKNGVLIESKYQSLDQMVGKMFRAEARKGKEECFKGMGEVFPTPRIPISLPKPQALHPKAETRNPKAESRNPEP